MNNFYIFVFFNIIKRFTYKRLSKKLCLRFFIFVIEVRIINEELCITFSRFLKSVKN